jgi:hypothetical protein
MEILGARSRLKWLWLDDARGVSELGLSRMSQLRRLYSLRMHDVPLTNKVVGQLADLPVLCEFDIAACGVTAGGFEHIVRMRRLASLTIRYAPLTSEDFERLSTLTGILWLDLRNTRIDDSAIRSITNLPGLWHIDLRNTEITPSGVAELRSAFPKATVLEGDESPAP